MADAQIVAAWVAGGVAHLAVRVNEGTPLGQVEYVGRVPLDDDWQAMSPAQKKAALVQAVKAARDASLAPPTTDLGLTGSVTI